MKTGTFVQGTASLVFLAASTAALAAPVAINTADSLNGITDLFSATFDGALSPCTGGDPSYCAFFNGKPGSTRQIIVTPTPTGVINGVPLGITPVPAAGSYLDLSLNGGNTQVTLAGGTITFPTITLTISGGTPNQTDVIASGAGVVFDAAPQVASLNAQGQAEFLVNLAPATAVDFSAFSTVAFPPNGSCSGSFCGLIPILTLDMIRYRLFIDYDPSFTYFTASFIGQTGNNSILSITMNSAAPEIVVTDSRGAAGDLQIPFGDVTVSSTATQTVTVTNTGNANLLLGAVGLANPLAPPFAITNDTCTAATVAPAGTCTFNVTFSPGSVASFSDSLDIPSNDADEPSVTMAVSGNGTALPVPNITVSDSVAPTTDLQVPFGSAAIGTPLSQTVTVTNDGNADLIIGAVASANPLTGAFSVTADGCSGQTIVPAANCTIDIQFQPSAAGAVSDSFDIPSNDGADPTVTVAVSGTGTTAGVPDISVTDDAVPPNDLSVAFGNVTENTTRDRTITVTNVGGASLNVGSVAGTNPLAAPFSVVTDGCSGQSIAPSASCTVVVRYSPTDTTSSSDSLNIPSNDPDEATVTVAVSGTGITEGEGLPAVPKASGASGGFMAMDPGSLLLLAAAGALGLRRRTARRPD